MARWRGTIGVMFVLIGIGSILACPRPRRSPFAVHPAALAMEDPCRRMGTLHKESRGRLEYLRRCGVVSDRQWACMARALESHDEHFTAACRTRRVPFAEIAAAQRSDYAGCLGSGRSEDVACAVFSDEFTCLAERCEAPR